MYWGFFWENVLQLCLKHMPVLCLWFWGVFPIIPFSIFTYKKITIYLSLPVLFPFVPYHWHHESWVQKTRNVFHDTEKIGSTSNCRFSTTIRALRMIFNFIKFYLSGLKLLYSLMVPVHRW